MPEILKAEAAPEMQLHQVWFTVMKPKMLVLQNGQPAYDIVAACETLAAATGHVRNVPGGVIVINMAVFINPKTPLPSELRNQ